MVSVAEEQSILLLLSEERHGETSTRGGAFGGPSPRRRHLRGLHVLLHDRRCGSSMAILQTQMHKSPPSPSSRTASTIRMTTELMRPIMTTTSGTGPRRNSPPRPAFSWTPTKPKLTIDNFARFFSEAWPFRHWPRRRWHIPHLFNVAIRSGVPSPDRTASSSAIGMTNSAEW